MKSLTLSLALLFCAPWLAAQVHFIPVWTGNGLDHMNFYVTTAKIDGQNMLAGDEIGIFDGDYCVGAGILTDVIVEGSNYLAMVASKNDAVAPEVNGYTPGNTVSIRLWDSSEVLEITYVNVTYISGTDIFSIGGTSSIRVEGSSSAPPVADAGEDQQVNEGDTVTLDGSGSYDPSEGILTYEWTPGPGIELDDSGSATTVFIAPEVEKDSAFSFILVVNNGSLDSEPDTVIVSVLDVNKIPVITGQSELSTDEEMPIIISFTDISVEDPDNTYPDDYTMVLAEGEHYSFAGLEITPATDYSGILEIPVTVNDGTDDSDPFMLELTVVNVNDTPYFTTFPADTTVTRNMVTVFEIQAGDADPEDILSISVSLDPVISQYNLTETGNGIAELSIEPSSGDLGPVLVTISLTDNLIASPVEQSFNIDFHPMGLESLEAGSAISIRFDRDAGLYLLRNNLAELLDVELIQVNGSVVLKTVLEGGQEKGISLPGNHQGIYLLRYSGASVSGTVKILLK